MNYENREGVIKYIIINYNSMKKLIFMLVALMGSFAVANATDVYVSYGGYTQMDAMDCSDGVQGLKTGWGTLNAGVDFPVIGNFTLGPSYTFSSQSTNGGSHASHAYYHVIMLNGKYNYYRNGIFSLYGHVGLGGMISHLSPKHDDSYNRGYFAFQVSPVGANVKLTNNFNAFAELGFGAQGIAQVGFKMNF